MRRKWGEERGPAHGGGGGCLQEGDGELGPGEARRGLGALQEGGRQEGERKADGDR